VAVSQNASQKTKNSNAAPATTAKSSNKSTSTSASVQGAFVAELGSKYYYPRDAAVAKRLDPAKTISYKNESAARRAGKKPAPKLAKTTGDLSAARAAYEKGAELYGQASGATASKARDQLCKDAFVALTEAMRDYRGYLAKNEDDAEAAATLRKVMQMRYGAMKYQRS
jgi:hypothetical protein